MKPPSSVITILICASLTAGFVALFFISPAVGQYHTAVMRQSKSSAANDYRHAQEQASAKQAAALAIVRPQVLDLLPPSDLQYDLVVQVESLAHSLGIPLTSLSVTGAIVPAAGAPTATPATAVATPVGPLSVALSVGVTGTYFQVRQFVQALPTLSRSLTITQLSVNTAAAVQKDATSSSNQVSASLTASASYQLPITQKKS